MRGLGATHGNSSVDNIKDSFADGTGVGRDTVDAIFKTRGIESRVKFIREACATLKASGEHDRIVARVSAECRAAQEAEAELIRVAAAMKSWLSWLALLYPLAPRPEGPATPPLTRSKPTSQNWKELAARLTGRADAGGRMEWVVKIKGVMKSWLSWSASLTARRPARQTRPRKWVRSKPTSRHSKVSAGMKSWLSWLAMKRLPCAALGQRKSG